MKVVATVYIDRRRDGELEEVGQFTFTDLAEITARAITRQYRYGTEVHYADTSFKPRRFSWGKIEGEGVIES